MQSARPDRPEMEVLETGRPAGALARWLQKVFGRRRVHVAVTAVTAATVGLVGAATMSATVLDADRTDDARDERSSSAGTPPGLRPPPPRGRESPTGRWLVAQDLAIRSGPGGHVVTFSAVNNGTTAADPRELEVVGGFVDREHLEYTAVCAGVELAGRGAPRFRGIVDPGRRVFVRCRDTTPYGGRTAWIDPGSVTVRRTETAWEGAAVPM